MPEDIILQLRIGDMIQLEHVAPEQTRRFSARMIGYMPGGSLVVSAPMEDGNALLVSEGLQFSAMVLHEGSVFGFSSTVLLSSAKPYPHMHLSYPSRVDLIERNARRVDVNVPVKARSNRLAACDDETWELAMATDLSSTGVCLGASKSLGKKGELLQIEMRLELEDGTEVLDLVAVVRNISVDEHDDLGNDTEYYHGLEFCTVNRFQQLIIHGYVLENLVRDGASG